MNAVLAAFRGFSGYLGGILGADAYKKYLEHHASSGHAGPPLTEREFWRDRTDRQDASPQQRCC